MSTAARAAWSSAAKKEPAAPGRAIAAVATCGYLGSLVGPILEGALASVLGLDVAVMVAGALAVFVVALAPPLRVPAISADRTAS